MRQILSISQYQEIVRRYKKQGTAANDYLQNEVGSLVSEGRIYCFEGEANVAFSVKGGIGSRIYYYVNDWDEKIRLPDDDCVVELLYRESCGLPEKELLYLLSLGFEKNLIRDQYCAMTGNCSILAEEGKCIVDNAQLIEDIKKAAELFNRSFDNLSGCYIGEAEYGPLLAGKCILIARDAGGGFLGALHHSKNGRVSNLIHLAVAENARGMGIGKRLCSYWISANSEDAKTRFALWVQRQNERAISLYKSIGFVHNGKTTLSLIKRKNENG